jgi:hypothetical protein
MFLGAPERGFERPYRGWGRWGWGGAGRQAGAGGGGGAPESRSI